MDLLNHPYSMSLFPTMSRLESIAVWYRLRGIPESNKTVVPALCCTFAAGFGLGLIVSYFLFRATAKPTTTSIGTQTEIILEASPVSRTPPSLAVITQHATTDISRSTLENRHNNFNNDA
ncbi:hypothetical protein KPH14_002788 [Odynerus spinipes]|uniref:Uncharacterized protein n=1 Tax=Odynerus spinipes TaxID=1348599 RepID=A0AAD9RM97_9HYME|nr:hypothetical protein KPH14_002788 [Odynerus spinipes]